eukprot:c23196_g1_i1 orf=337-1683(-)
MNSLSEKMGGEGYEPSINFDYSEDVFLCEAISGGLVEADRCTPVDGSMPESSISQEVSEKIQGLLVAGSMRSKGNTEKRIQLQNEALFEGSKQSLEDMREWIKSYRPGDCIYKVGGMSRSGFAIPEATTLLIVGPVGSGKSCLINNMIRVLDNVTSGFNRAQTYVESENGSLFLQEYFLYKDAKHFCVFDSRGFSKTDVIEDLDIVKGWMTDGICHGEAVCRPSDSKMIGEAIEGRGRQGHYNWTVKRRVDFVIFVVNAFTVYGMIKSHDLRALESLAVLYSSPFLSFKDDVPVVVMTHGDKLSPQDRVFTRIFIGELFGVSPVDQVFDISCFTERSVHPGDVDTVNDLVMLNMLKFSLERADKNLPHKATAALLQNRMWGIVADRWNGLGIQRQRFLLIIIAAWLLSALLLLITCNSKSSPGFRSLRVKHFWKLHKKLRLHKGLHRS